MSTTADYNLERGLPASLDIERSLLGAILLDSTLWIEVAASLVADDFSLDANRRIFAAMQNIDARGIPVEIGLVADELKNRNELDSIGGISYLSELTDGNLGKDSIEHYTQIVLDKAKLRGIISVCQQAIGEAFDHPEDAGEVLDRTEQAIMQLADLGTKKKQFISLLDATGPTYEAMCKDGRAKVPMPLEALNDRMNGGIWDAEFVIMGGDPGSAKSAFAIQTAAEFARAGHRVAFFSMEMKREQIMRRLWCYESDLFYSKLKKNPNTLERTDQAKLMAAMDTVAAWPIYINDSSALTPQSFAAQSRHAVLRDKAELIVLDHIQIMTSIMPGDNEVTKVTKVSATCRQLAKDYAPVIALSQLARQSKEQKAQRPTMRDLKGSSSLEQDAAVILLSWRPIVDGEETGEDELIFGKNREGERRTVTAKFEGGLMRWTPRDVAL